MQVPTGGAGEDIIQDLSMTFTTNIDLNPTGCSTMGAPLIFVSLSNSSCKFNNGNKDNIFLFNVSPISSFNIVYSDDINLTITINLLDPGLKKYAHKGGDYVVTPLKQ